MCNVGLTDVVDNNIRVEKADLDHLRLSSIPLAEGGYVAQLGVFHELHCLVSRLAMKCVDEHFTYNSNRRKLGIGSSKIITWRRRILAKRNGKSGRRTFVRFPKVAFSQTFLLTKSLQKDHCLEMLRLAIMCRGDTSLSTFKWIGTSNQRVPTALDESPHQCVNWDSLVMWTRERSVNISAPGTLIDEQGGTFP